MHQLFELLFNVLPSVPNTTTLVATDTLEEKECLLDLVSEDHFVNGVLLVGAIMSQQALHSDHARLAFSDLLGFGFLEKSDLAFEVVCADDHVYFIQMIEPECHIAPEIRFLQALIPSELAYELSKVVLVCVG